MNATATLPFPLPAGVRYDGAPPGWPQPVHFFTDLDPASPAYLGTFAVLGTPSAEAVQREWLAQRARFAPVS